MTATSPSILRRALALLNARFILLQLGLALLSFVLFAAWLRVPDSGVLDVIVSILLATLILVVAFVGEASLFLRLRASTHSRRDLLRGAAILVVMVLLWFGWNALLDHFSLNDDARAGYLNSRFPHGLRNIFSYKHLLRWSGWFWVVMRWLGTGVLLAIAVVGTFKPSLRILRSGTYWLVLIISAVLTSLVTGTLLHWTPGHGLSVESISLLLRLSTVIVFDVAIACFVLAIITALLQRTEGT